MKSYIIICLFLISFLSWPALGNRLPEQWKPGAIHLAGESVRGDVSYDPKMDVVFCKAEGKIQTFTPQTVLHFEYYDEEAGLTRSYSSFPHHITASRQQRAFFEVVIDGDLTLLRKGKFSKIPRPKGKYHRVHNKIRDSHQKPDIVYSYYLLQQAGPQQITHFRRQVLPLMHDLKEEMQEFIQSHNFNMESPQSHILIINYYNHLKKDFISMN